MATRKGPVAGPARRFTDAAGALDTVIGRGTRLEGELEGETNVDLRGSFVGPCRIEGLFWQRPQATFRGELQATNVVLEGTFEGTVVAAEKVELRSTARVYGVVRARTMAIAEGCFFKGRVDMEKGEEGRAHPTTFREARGSGAPAEERRREERGSRAGRNAPGAGTERPPAEG